MDTQPLPSTTHYQVLGLTPSILDSHHDPAALLKRAYRRALLQNHPDKVAAAAAGGNGGIVHTVDQITTAFNVLSSPRDRAAYDNAQRLSRPDGQGQTQTNFQTGVENVDLDDLPYDEKTGSWHRGCRCGNERAYLFGEDDLEACGDAGELMVGCQDCSLWLRIHFAVVEDSPQ